MEFISIADGDLPPVRLSDIYDEALPEVYAYLRSRCGSIELAEELTSATFVQAALVWSKGTSPEVSIPWLITVARNKLIDHWRHLAVVDRSLGLLARDNPQSTDPWNVVLDQAHAGQILAELPSHYRAVLTLRYLDDLPVRTCAGLLDRTVHSTESLLVRARSAFRKAYELSGGNDE